MGALKDGDYDEAIYQATATEPKDGEMTAARSYDELDAELSDLIGQARIAMRSYLERGLTAMTAVSSAVFLQSGADAQPHGNNGAQGQQEHGRGHRCHSGQSAL